jgi:HipA-like protein
MRAAQVLYNGRLAGILSKSAGTYRFVYDKNYLSTPGSRPVSLTLPFQEAPYESNVLFPVFINMLSEGDNKAIQNRLLKIDENDYFSLLLATAGSETIGPLTIKEIHEPTRD